MARLQLPKQTSSQKRILLPFLSFHLQPILAERATHMTRFQKEEHEEGLALKILEEISYLESTIFLHI
jgi:hypothetical protein